MSIKPILFNTEMVKAILDGRKTVTRRNPFKFEMKDGYNPEWSGYSLGEYFTGHIETGVCLYSRGAHDVWGVRSNVVKPKYQVGDILYVRETYVYENKKEEYIYKASKETYEHIGTHDDINWHPSIHMPKEAARIFLKVADVKVERLQDITDPDCCKEGIDLDSVANIEDMFPNLKGCNAEIQNGSAEKCVFGTLWDSTVKDGNYFYSANPWVWVIEFERCEKPKGWCLK